MSDPSKQPAAPSAPAPSAPALPSFFLADPPMWVPQSADALAAPTRADLAASMTPAGPAAAPPAPAGASGGH